MSRGQAPARLDDGVPPPRPPAAASSPRAAEGPGTSPGARGRSREAAGRPGRAPAALRALTMGTGTRHLESCPAPAAPASSSSASSRSTPASGRRRSPHRGAAAAAIPPHGARGRASSAPLGATPPSWARGSGAGKGWGAEQPLPGLRSPPLRRAPPGKPGLRCRPSGCSSRDGGGGAGGSQVTLPANGSPAGPLLAPGCAGPAAGSGGPGAGRRWDVAEPPPAARGLQLTGGGRGRGRNGGGGRGSGRSPGAVSAR